MMAWHKAVSWGQFQILASAGIYRVHYFLKQINNVKVQKERSRFKANLFHEYSCNIVWINSTVTRTNWAKSYSYGVPRDSWIRWTISYDR